MMSKIILLCSFLSSVPVMNFMTVVCGVLYGYDGHKIQTTRGWYLVTAATRPAMMMITDGVSVGIFCNEQTMEYDMMSLLHSPSHPGHYTSSPLFFNVFRMENGVSETSMVKKDIRKGFRQLVDGWTYNSSF